jgi:hypothetical protein
VTDGVAMDRPDFSADGRQRATAIVTGPRWGPPCCAWHVARLLS